ncbi:MAG: 6-carboxytetrahydropterin synthase QueD [Firmicutes bacterium]|nr:6-carboxytetrahydropterin synthase QueD [Bacillota bacterium]
MYELSVRTRFAAAHFLRDYSGSCSRLHGHTWSVEVLIGGKALDHKGMVLDFKEVKDALKKIVGELDHQNLNELDAFKGSGENNPTAENLARYIFSRLKRELTPAAGDISIRSVRVWESPDAWASYREGT